MHALARKPTTLIVIISTALLHVILAHAQFYPPLPSPEAGGPTAEAGGPTTVEAGGPSVAPEEVCFKKLLNVSDCLTYVTEGSNLSVPDQNCCPELSRLVESKPVCLCQLLGNSEKLVGFQIEISKALKLPSVCKVSTPPVSLCSVLGYPVQAPSSEPSPAPTGDAASSPSSGDKGASVIASSPQPLLLVLAFASLVMFA